MTPRDLAILTVAAAADVCYLAGDVLRSVALHHARRPR